MKFRSLLPLLLVPLVPWSEQRLDNSIGQLSPHDVLYLWSAEKVKLLGHGFENILADMYWLRTIQYYGAERAFAKDPRYDLLLPLTEITTTLDPRFEMAYRYGAVFLSELPPRGAGDPQAALALLQRGVFNNPRSWRLRFDKGALEFFSLMDPRTAATTLIDGGKLEGAPYWLTTLAGSLLSAGGEREAARQIWMRFYEQDTGLLRENARVQLERLAARDQIDRLSDLVRRFATKLGRRPSSLAELGLPPASLRDPTGTPFAYDPATGFVWFARESKIYASPPANPEPPADHNH